MDEIILYVMLCIAGICALLALAGAGTQNYCRCIREPRGDDEDDDDLYPDLYPDLYSECKEDSE
jgi:hypothetical protein